MRILGRLLCLLTVCLCGYAAGQVFQDGKLITSVGVIDLVSVTLAWDASTSTNVSGYHIYFGGASGAYTNMLDAGTNLVLAISGLATNSTYFFAATAYNAEAESDFSAEISWTSP
jgi:hypothetical protein